MKTAGHGASGGAGTRSRERGRVCRRALADDIESAQERHDQRGNDFSETLHKHHFFFAVSGTVFFGTAVLFRGTELVLIAGLVAEDCALAGETDCFGALAAAGFFW